MNLGEPLDILIILESNFTVESIMKDLLLQVSRDVLLQNTSRGESHYFKSSHLDDFTGVIEHRGEGVNKTNEISGIVFSVDIINNNKSSEQGRVIFLLATPDFVSGMNFNEFARVWDLKNNEEDNEPNVIPLVFGSAGINTERL